MNENQIRTLVNHPFLVLANYMVNIWNLCRAVKRVNWNDFEQGPFCCLLLKQRQNGAADLG